MRWFKAPVPPPSPHLLVDDLVRIGAADVKGGERREARHVVRQQARPFLRAVLVLRHVLERRDVRDPRVAGPENTKTTPRQ